VRGPLVLELDLESGDEKTRQTALGEPGGHRWNRDDWLIAPAIARTGEPRVVALFKGDDPRDVVRIESDRAVTAKLADLPFVVVVVARDRIEVLGAKAAVQSDLGVAGEDGFVAYEVTVLRPAR
jgi:hypothetical protein